MTTQKFYISERESNGKFARMSEYATRAEANKVLADIFTKDENADPQNFKIEVEEIVDEVATLVDASERLQAGLGIFFKAFEVHKYFTDGGEGFIEMLQLEKYPSLSYVEIKKMFTILEVLNAELPNGYEVFFSISDKCGIRLFLSTPKKD